VGTVIFEKDRTPIIFTKESLVTFDFVTDVDFSDLAHLEI